MHARAERRIAKRKATAEIFVSEMTLLKYFVRLSNNCRIVEASASGFLVHVNRTDLVPKQLRENVTLDSLHGEEVGLFLPQMNLDIIGRVVRHKLLGGGLYEVAIDFTDDAPEYWRQCLYDLLPEPGELD